MEADDTSCQVSVNDEIVDADDESKANIGCENANQSWDEGARNLQGDVSFTPEVSFKVKKEHQYEMIRDTDTQNEQDDINDKFDNKIMNTEDCEDIKEELISTKENHMEDDATIAEDKNDREDNKEPSTSTNLEALNSISQCGPSCKCSDCSETSGKPSKVKILSSQSEEKIHECLTCKKLFSTSSSLKRHQLTHTGEKNHTCDV